MAESLIRKLKEYIRNYGVENVDVVKKVKRSSKKKPSSTKGKIINPVTGRLVLKSGKIGEKLIAKYNRDEKSEISDFIKAKKHSNRVSSEKKEKALLKAENVLRNKLERVREKKEKEVKFSRPLEEKRSETYKVLREFSTDKLRKIAKNLLLYPQSKIDNLPKSELVSKLSKIKPPVPPNLSEDALRELELEEANERPSLPRGVFDIISNLRDEEDNNYKGNGRRRSFRKTPHRRRTR